MHRYFQYIDVTTMNNKYKGRPFCATAKIDLKYRSQIGVPFTKDQKLYPVQPEGDTVRTAVMLHQKYRPNPVLEIVTN